MENQKIEDLQIDKYPHASVAILQVLSPEGMEANALQRAWQNMRDELYKAKVPRDPNSPHDEVLLRIPMPEKWPILARLSEAASRYRLSYKVELFGPSLLAYVSSGFPSLENASRDSLQECEKIN